MSKRLPLAVFLFIAPL